MPNVFFNVIAVVGVAALVSCTQRAPEPVAPEPIYNKHGDVVGGCIPDRPSPNITYAPNLPRCDNRCPPGQQSATAANTDQNICVPVPRDGGDQPDSGRPNPNTPTTGN